MVELSLPKNSKITKENLWKKYQESICLIFIDGIENREITQAWINSILIKKN